MALSWFCRTLVPPYAGCRVYEKGLAITVELLRNATFQSLFVYIIAGERDYTRLNRYKNMMSS